jgi:O-antigen ligase
MVLPLALALLLWKIEETKTDFVNRNILQVILLMLSVGLLLLALFTTQSRSGWVAAIFASVVVLLMLSWVARGFFLVAGLAGTFIGLAGSFTMNLVSYDNTRQTLYYTIIQRFADAIAIFKIENIAVIELTDSNFATLERLAHWQAAWNMWRDNFWFGVGFGNYEIVYPTYAIGRWDDPLGHAHNYLFNLGAETGLIGVTCYLIFWILTFGVIWQAIKYSFGLNRAIIIGGLGILVHLHIHNLFDNLYVQGMYLHVAIILALISLCKENLVRVK